MNQAATKLLIGQWDMRSKSPALPEEDVSDLF